VAGAVGRPSSSSASARFTSGSISRGLIASVASTSAITRASSGSDASTSPCSAMTAARLPSVDARPTWVGPSVASLIASAASKSARARSYWRCRHAITARL
jgi:hypothetical protein